MPVPFIVRRNSRWASAYRDIMQILGDKGILLPIGDPEFDDPTTTSLTLLTGKDAGPTVATYSKAPASFATPFNINSLQGGVPRLQFGGSGAGEYLSIADHADLSFGNGTTDSVFVMGMCLNPDSVGTTRALMSKWDAPDDREYSLLMTAADKLRMHVRDESLPETCFRETTNALSEGIPACIAMHYSAVAAPLAGNNITLYVNKDAPTMQAADNGGGTYVAMEALGQDVQIAGRNDPLSDEFPGAIYGGPCGPWLAPADLPTTDIAWIHRIQMRLLGI